MGCIWHLFYVIKYYFLQESKLGMCGIVMNVGVCFWERQRKVDFFHLISLTYQADIFTD